MVSARMLHVTWVFVLKCSPAVPVCLMLLRLSFPSSTWGGLASTSAFLPLPYVLPFPSVSSYILLIYFSLFLVKLPPVLFNYSSSPCTHPLLCFSAQPFEKNCFVFSALICISFLLVEFHCTSLSSRVKLESDKMTGRTLKCVFPLGWKKPNWSIYLYAS